MVSVISLFHCVTIKSDPAIIRDSRRNPESFDVHHQHEDGNSVVAPFMRLKFIIFFLITDFFHRRVSYRGDSCMIWSGVNRCMCAPSIFRDSVVRSLVSRIALLPAGPFLLPASVPISTTSSVAGHDRRMYCELQRRMSRVASIGNSKESRICF